MPPRHNPTPPPDDGNFIRQIKEALVPEFEHIRKVVFGTADELNAQLKETKKAADDAVATAAAAAAQTYEEVKWVRKNAIYNEENNQVFRNGVDNNLQDIKKQFDTFKGEFSELKTHVDTGFNSLTDRLDTTNDLLGRVIDELKKLGPKL